MDGGKTNRDSAQSPPGGAGDLQSREHQVFEFVLGSALLVTVAGSVAHVLLGSAANELAASVAAVALVLIAWVLVRMGHIQAASFLLPSVGWVLANFSILTSNEPSPITLAGVNAIVTLMAAALIGPGAVLLLTSLTVFLGGSLAALDLLGMLGSGVLAATSPIGWLGAGAIYTMISLFAYLTIRQQRAAALDAERRADQLSTLSAAAATITASLDRDEAIQRILKQLETVVPYDSASVQVLGDGYVEIVGGRGWDQPETVVGIRFPVPADNPNTVVIETQEPCILDDAPAAHSAFDEPPHNHIRSWLGVPLLLGERTLGMLAVDSYQPGHYSDEHAQLASAFADHVAIALENARLFEAEQQRRQWTAIQQDITQVTSSSLDLETVLRRVARLTAAATEADRCLLFLVDTETGELTLESAQSARNGMPPEELTRLKEGLEPEWLFLEDLAAKYQVINFSPQSEHREVPPDWRRTLNVHSMLIAPLVTHERLLGAMVLLRLKPATGFSEDEITLAQTLAASVSTSIENARLYADKEQLALTDPLTDLYNRRGLTQLAQREMEWVHRYGRPLSVLLLDLDHFKVLNDSHGHVVGDQVLAGVAQRLRSQLRGIDVISRYGGEEFVVLLPDCDAASARIVAERVRASIEAESFATDSGDLDTTVSIGITSTEGSPADLEALVEHADQAMYAAKQAGRNRAWAWREGNPIPANPD